ncbi:MAG: hypothetical protein WAW39_17830 [Prosthecobacter sp.]|uniref:hypothetical protein n=1 Tax=Prosthecobacter sp. TaxID=1965333 RepID=UPI003BAF9AFB
MDWRHILYPALLILLLWLGPYVSVIFQQDFSKTSPDTSASDRRLIRLCLRGVIVITAALLLLWWLG